MADTPTEFFSLRDISRLLDVPSHRIKWVIKSRGIAPAHRAGSRAVYGLDALGKVALGLQETTERWRPLARPTVTATR